MLFTGHLIWNLEYAVYLPGNSPIDGRLKFL